MNRPEIRLNLLLMRSKVTYFCLGIGLAVILIALIYGISTWGKEPIEPNPVRRQSPTAIANLVHQPSGTYMKIVFGQPYKRGRKIFGNIVPYGKTWRTGANEATELTVTRDILFAGEKLKAGTYCLFTIPRKNEPWTVILNGQLGQWGDFQYQPENDVLRVSIPAKPTESVVEAFTIQFTGIDKSPTDIPIFKNDSTNIVLAWDHTKIKIPIVFLDE